MTSSIAVAHGGWRGTAGNIAGEAVRHLQESYGAEPKNIKAGIGPAIGKSVFEVEKMWWKLLKRYLIKKK